MAGAARREEYRVLFQFTENVELAGDQMPPGAHDVEFVIGQVGRVFIHKLPDEVEVGAQGITDLEPDLRRQGGKFFRRGNLVGDHLEALVHEEHQRTVQLEEQFDILGFEQHGVHQSLQRGRCDFDAIVRPDHHDLGADDLPLVIREHLQLPLHQRLHDLADIGKIAWRDGRVVLPVAFDVLLKLLPSNFGRSAGHVPGATNGGQAADASLRGFCPR